MSYDDLVRRCAVKMPREFNAYMRKEYACALIAVVRKEVEKMAIGSFGAYLDKHEVLAMLTPKEDTSKT